MIAGATVIQNEHKTGIFRQSGQQRKKDTEPMEHIGVLQVAHISPRRGWFSCTTTFEPECVDIV
jgi:hypothetical protein